MSEKITPEIPVTVNASGKRGHLTEFHNSHGTAYTMRLEDGEVTYVAPSDVTLCPDFWDATNKALAARWQNMLDSREVVVLGSVYEDVRNGIRVKVVGVPDSPDGHIHMDYVDTNQGAYTVKGHDLMDLNKFRRLTCYTGLWQYDEG